ncbi:MAG: Rod shape-determining protein MreC [Planctomycetaceae bacterium]|nr:Rod shape-determining protein MreC [Planctomycetaceae bacterium]
MHRTTSFTWQITALALITLGLGLMLLPDDLSGPIRRAARDFSRPGQAVTTYCSELCHAGWDTLQAWQARRTEVIQLTGELDRARKQNAEFQLRLANLQQELNVSERKRAEKASASSSNPLFVPDLIEARVLGHETVALHAGRKILGVGSAKGIGENLLVVDAKYPTLDLGLGQGMTVHSPVFAGHAVVGRTINCGNYSCSLQSVTDIKFSGPAQLMRRTATVLHPGPE